MASYNLFTIFLPCLQMCCLKVSVVDSERRSCNHYILLFCCFVHSIASFLARVTPAAPGVSAKSGSSSDLFSDEENEVRVASTTERAIDDGDVGGGGGIITLDYPGIDADEDFGEEHRSEIYRAPPRGCT